MPRTRTLDNRQCRSCGNDFRPKTAGRIYCSQACYWDDRLKRNRPGGKKRCPACEEFKDPAEFYKNSGSSDGLAGYCKRCLDAKNRANTERLRSRQEIQRAERRTCPSCRKDLPATSYYADKSRADGLSYMCKPCWRADVRRNPPVMTDERRRRIRAAHYVRRYGASADEALALAIRAESDACDICGEREDSRHNKTQRVGHLSVDHCHATGRIRGLLCFRCNTILGRVNESPELLRRLADYIEQERPSQYT